jgi:hypothetical protein
MSVSVSGELCQYVIVDLRMSAADDMYIIVLGAVIFSLVRFLFFLSNTFTFSRDTETTALKRLKEGVERMYNVHNYTSVRVLDLIRSPFVYIKTMFYNFRYYKQTMGSIWFMLYSMLTLVIFIGIIAGILLFDANEDTPIWVALTFKPLKIIILVLVVSIVVFKVGITILSCVQMMTRKNMFRAWLMTTSEYGEPLIKSLVNLYSKYDYQDSKEEDFDDIEPRDEFTKKEKKNRRRVFRFLNAKRMVFEKSVNSPEFKQYIAPLLKDDEWKSNVHRDFSTNFGNTKMNLDVVMEEGLQTKLINSPLRMLDQRRANPTQAFTKDIQTWLVHHVYKTEIETKLENVANMFKVRSVLEHPLINMNSKITKLVSYLVIITTLCGYVMYSLEGGSSVGILSTVFRFSLHGYILLLIIVIIIVMAYFVEKAIMVVMRNRTNRGSVWRSYINSLIAEPHMAITEEDFNSMKGEMAFENADGKLWPELKHIMKVVATDKLKYMITFYGNPFNIAFLVAIIYVILTYDIVYYSDDNTSNTRRSFNETVEQFIQMMISLSVTIFMFLTLVIFIVFNTSAVQTHVGYVMCMLTTVCVLVVLARYAFAGTSDASSSSCEPETHG